MAAQSIISMNHTTQEKRLAGWQSLASRQDRIDTLHRQIIAARENLARAADWERAGYLQTLNMRLAMLRDILFQMPIDLYLNPPALRTAAERELLGVAS